MAVLAFLGLMSAIGATKTADGTEKTNKTPIEHVVVLMLENRSLDHMLGFLKQKNSNVNGCLPNQQGCLNPKDPLDSSSPTYTVDDSAIYVQASPSHSISGTTQQIFGSNTGTEAKMNGFIASYDKQTKGQGEAIMKCFSPEHVPVLANLTSEFLLFDGWFSSVPGV